MYFDCWTCRNDKLPFLSTSFKSINNVGHLKWTVSIIQWLTSNTVGVGWLWVHYDMIWQKCCFWWESDLNGLVICSTPKPYSLLCIHLGLKIQPVQKFKKILKLLSGAKVPKHTQAHRGHPSFMLCFISPCPQRAENQGHFGQKSDNDCH